MLQNTTKITELKTNSPESFGFGEYRFDFYVGSNSEALLEILKIQNDRITSKEDYLFEYRFVESVLNTINNGNQLSLLVGSEGADNLNQIKAALFYIFINSNVTGKQANNSGGNSDQQKINETFLLFVNQLFSLFKTKLKNLDLSSQVNSLLELEKDLRAVRILEISRQINLEGTKEIVLEALENTLKVSLNSTRQGLDLEFFESQAIIEILFTKYLANVFYKEQEKEVSDRILELLRKVEEGDKNEQEEGQNEAVEFARKAMAGTGGLAAGAAVTAAMKASQTSLDQKTRRVQTTTSKDPKSPNMEPTNFGQNKEGQILEPIPTGQESQGQVSEQTPAAGGILDQTETLNSDPEANSSPEVISTSLPKEEPDSQDNPIDQRLEKLRQDEEKEIDNLAQELDQRIRQEIVKKQESEDPQQPQNQERASQVSEDFVRATALKLINQQKKASKKALSPEFALQRVEQVTDRFKRNQVKVAVGVLTPDQVNQVIEECTTAQVAREVQAKDFDQNEIEEIIRQRLEQNYQKAGVSIPKDREGFGYMQQQVAARVSEFDININGGVSTTPSNFDLGARLVQAALALGVVSAVAGPTDEANTVVSKPSSAAGVNSQGVSNIPSPGISQSPTSRVDQGGERRRRRRSSSLNPQLSPVGTISVSPDEKVSQIPEQEIIPPFVKPPIIVLPSEGPDPSDPVYQQLGRDINQEDRFEPSTFRRKTADLQGEIRDSKRRQAKEVASLDLEKLRKEDEALEQIVDDNGNKSILDPYELDTYWRGQENFDSASPGDQQLNGEYQDQRNEVLAGNKLDNDAYRAQAATGRTTPAMLNLSPLGRYRLPNRSEGEGGELGPMDLDRTDGPDLGGRATRYKDARIDRDQAKDDEFFDNLQTDKVGIDRQVEGKDEQIRQYEALNDPSLTASERAEIEERLIDNRSLADNLKDQAYQKAKDLATEGVKKVGRTAGRAAQKMTIQATSAAVNAVGGFLTTVGGPVLAVILIIAAVLALFFITVIGVYCIPLENVRDKVFEPSFYAAERIIGGKNNAITGARVVINGFFGIEVPDSIVKKFFADQLGCKDQSPGFSCPAGYVAYIKNPDGTYTLAENGGGGVAGGTPGEGFDCGSRLVTATGGAKGRSPSWIPSDIPRAFTAYITMISAMETSGAGLGMRANYCSGPCVGKYQIPLRELTSTAADSVCYRTNQVFPEISISQCQSVYEKDEVMQDKAQYARLVTRGAAPESVLRSYFGTDVVSVVNQSGLQFSSGVKPIEHLRIIESTLASNGNTWTQEVERQLEAIDHYDQAYGDRASCGSGIHEICRKKQRGQPVLREYFNSNTYERIREGCGGSDVQIADNQVGFNDFNLSNLNPLNFLRPVEVSAQEDEQAVRNRVADYYKNGEFYQVRPITSNTESAIRNGQFDFNIVQFLDNVHRAGFALVTGPRDWGRGSGDHVNPSRAVDIWGVGRLSDIKGEPIKGFKTSGRGARWAGGYPDKAVNNGNTPDPRIRRHVDIGNITDAGIVDQEAANLFEGVYDIAYGSGVGSQFIANKHFKNHLNSKGKTKVSDTGSSSRSVQNDGDIGGIFINEGWAHTHHFHVAMVAQRQGDYKYSDGISPSGGSGVGGNFSNIWCCPIGQAHSSILETSTDFDQDDRDEENASGSDDPDEKDSQGVFLDPSLIIRPIQTKAQTRPSSYESLSDKHKQFLAEIGAERGYQGYEDTGSVNSELQSKLNEMIAAANRDGVNLNPTSLYRSYNDQVGTYFNSSSSVTNPIPNDRIFQDSWTEGTPEYEAAKEAYLARATVSAPPGFSKHATGLVVDFTTSENNNALDNSFQNTQAFRSLQNNAETYGFELSNDGSNGSDYESWEWYYSGGSTKLEDLETQGSSGSIEFLSAGADDCGCILAAGGTSSRTANVGEISQCLKALIDDKSDDETITLWRGNAGRVSQDGQIPVRHIKEVINAGNEAGVSQETITFVITLMATETGGKEDIWGPGTINGIGCFGVAQLCPGHGYDSSLGNGGWAMVALGYIPTINQFTVSGGPDENGKNLSHRALQMAVIEAGYEDKKRMNAFPDKHPIYGATARWLGSGCDGNGTCDRDYGEAAFKNFQIITCASGVEQQALTEIELRNKLTNNNSNLFYFAQADDGQGEGSENEKDQPKETNTVETNSEMASNSKKPAYCPNPSADLSGTSLANIGAICNDGEDCLGKDELSRWQLIITDCFYSPREYRNGTHWGTDYVLRNPNGDPFIPSPIAGEVSFVGSRGAGGNSIFIRGADGKEYRFHHLRQPSNLKVGDRVSAGNIIGIMGNTGESYGAHVDIKIKAGGSSNGGYEHSTQFVIDAYKKLGITNISNNKTGQSTCTREGVKI